MTIQQKTAAIIVAAGESRRMNGVDKVLALLAGRPVISYALDAFEKCGAISQIIVVASKASLAKCRELIADKKYSKPIDVCAGGKRRQDSVAAGLKQVKDCEWVVVHDGARPLIRPDLIEGVLRAAAETGAAIAAVPVTDTIKLAGKDGAVLRTLSRQDLWAAQTPQAFRSDIIMWAYRQVKGEVTDDAALVEKLGYRVRLYTGAHDNIKITNPGDLTLAEAMLKDYDK